MTKTAKTILWIVIIVVVIVVIVLVNKGGSNTAEAGPIKIGVTAPLTGELANIGENAKAAIDIAAEEINAAGGINGRELQLVYEDDKCGGTDAVQAMSKLINVDKVTAVLGSVCSPAVLAFAPIAEEAKMPVMGYCSTAPKISEAGDYIFRDVPSDLFQATHAAKYIYNTLGKRKAAVLNVNNDWGLGVSGAFKKAFRDLGGEIVIEESYDATSKDLRTQMSKIKASSADVFYFAGFTDGSIAGIRQAKAIGLSIPMFGADAWDDNKLWDEVGTVGDGAMFTRVGTNSSEAFKAKMLEKLGNDSIVYCSNYGYDGLKILAGVIADVGTDRTAIKDALYNVRYEGGVSSPLIEFDQNGDPKSASYTISIVRNGKPEVLQ
jgi:branched-chain amino acid transport system substrate-binding protein